MAAILNKEKKTKSRDDLVGFDSNSSDSDVEEPEKPAEKENIVVELPEENTEPVCEIEDAEERKESEAKPDLNKSEVKPTPADELLHQKKTYTKAVWVPVSRKQEIQEARLKLPILAEEQIIMEVKACRIPRF